MSRASVLLPAPNTWRDSREPFLAALREHHPEILDSLRRDVYPVFLSTGGPAVKFGRAWVILAEGDFRSSMLEWAQAFAAWQARFPWMPFWIVEAAVNACGWWAFQEVGNPVREGTSRDLITLDWQDRVGGYLTGC